MIYHRLLAAILTFQLSVGAFAQQPVTTKTPAQSVPAPQQPASKPIEDDDVVRITTNLVQLDAVVTDSKGRVVTDLGPEEFDILENGKSQKITNLSYVSLESSEVTRSQLGTSGDKTARKMNVQRPTSKVQSLRLLCTAPSPLIGASRITTIDVGPWTLDLGPL